jgi:hypothetical protein
MVIFVISDTIFINRTFHVLLPLSVKRLFAGKIPFSDIQLLAKQNEHLVELPIGQTTIQTKTFRLNEH